MFIYTHQREYNVRTSTGRKPENIFICQPVDDSTQEVKPKELSYVYGVECVQILDRIAFNDEKIEYTF